MNPSHISSKTCPTTHLSTSTSKTVRISSSVPSAAAASRDITANGRNSNNDSDADNQKQNTDHNGHATITNGNGEKRYDTCSRDARTLLRKQSLWFKNAPFLRKSSSSVSLVMSNNTDDARQAVSDSRHKSAPSNAKSNHSNQPNNNNNIDSGNLAGRYSSISDICADFHIFSKSMDNLTSINNFNSYSVPTTSSETSSITDFSQNNITKSRNDQKEKRRQSAIEKIFNDSSFYDNFFIHSNTNSNNKNNKNNKNNNKNNNNNRKPTSSSSGISLPSVISINPKKNKFELSVNKQAESFVDKSKIPVELNLITPTLEIPPTLLDKTKRFYNLNQQELVSEINNNENNNNKNYNINHTTNTTKTKYIIDDYGEFYEFKKPFNSSSTTSRELLQSKVEQSLKAFQQLTTTLNNEKQLVRDWEQLFVKIELLKQAANNNRNKTSSFVDYEADFIGKFGVILRKIDHALYKRFKLLVEKGIPMKLRAKIWSIASGSKSLNQPGEFEFLLNDVDFAKQQKHDKGDLTLIKTSEKQIDLDCVRTMRSNVYFKNDNGPGMMKLKRILVAFSRKYPRIGYCQGMNLIVGNLLLVFVSEVETYYCFENLVTNILNPDFFKPPFKQVKDDVFILINFFFKENMPELFKYLVTDLQIDFNFFLFNWFLTLFLNVLPTDILFKVWDSVLCVSGETELLKTALSIFKFFETILMNEFEYSDEIYDFLINLKNKIISYNLTGNMLVQLMRSFDGVVNDEKLAYYRKRVLLA